MAPEADLVEGDVADAVDGRRRWCAGCDVVFHLAARGSVQRSVEQPLETDRANVSGTLTVLCAAHDAGVRRVVLSSSSSVYGGARQRPTREDQPLRPRSPYAVSKLAGEHYARVFAELHGLETVTLRYFNVFGPRQRADSQYAAVVPRFIDALRRGLPVEIHGDGRAEPRLHVRRRRGRGQPARRRGTRRGVRRAAPTTSPGASPTPCSSSCRASPTCWASTARRHHVASRPGDIRHSQASIEAARDDLGFRPRGIARATDWPRPWPGGAKPYQRGRAT